MRLQTTDLSRGGFYVELRNQFAVGMSLAATLWIDDTSIDVRGVVVTRHPEFGNGVMFTEFKNGAERLLNRYLDNLVER
jgi:hypothetical protein